MAVYLVDCLLCCRLIFRLRGDSQVSSRRRLLDREGHDMGPQGSRRTNGTVLLLTTGHAKASIEECKHTAVQRSGAGNAGGR